MHHVKLLLSPDTEGEGHSLLYIVCSFCSAQCVMWRRGTWSAEGHGFNEELKKYNWEQRIVLKNVSVLIFLGESAEKNKAVVLGTWQSFLFIIFGLVWFLWCKSINFSCELSLANGSCANAGWAHPYHGSVDIAIAFGWVGGEDASVWRTQ